MTKASELKPDEEEILKDLIKHLPNVNKYDLGDIAKTLELLGYFKKIPTVADESSLRINILEILKRRFPHSGEKSYENIKEVLDEIVSVVKPNMGHDSELAKALELILPLAKGYYAKNPIQINLEVVNQADQALANHKQRRADKGCSCKENGGYSGSMDCCPKCGDC